MKTIILLSSICLLSFNIFSQNDLTAVLDGEWELQKIYSKELSKFIFPDSELKHSLLFDCIYEKKGQCSIDEYKLEKGVLESNIRDGQLIFIDQKIFKVQWNTSERIYDNKEKKWSYQKYIHTYTYELKDNALVFTINTENDLKYYYKKKH